MPNMTRVCLQVPGPLPSNRNRNGGRAGRTQPAASRPARMGLQANPCPWPGPVSPRPRSVIPTKRWGVLPVRPPSPTIGPQGYHLPIHLPGDLAVPDLLEKMAVDKKNKGGTKYIAQGCTGRLWRRDSVNSLCRLYGPDSWHQHHQH